MSPEIAFVYISYLCALDTKEAITISPSKVEARLTAEYLYRETCMMMTS